MPKYLFGLLALITTILFFSACKKKTPMLDDEGVDTFWTTGNIQKYKGNEISIDSSLMEEVSPGVFIWEFRSTKVEAKTYLIKHKNDTIFATYESNKHLSGYTSILTSDRLNSLGWYHYEGNNFKFNQDTLLYNKVFLVPAYINGILIQREFRFEGHLEN